GRGVEHDVEQASRPGAPHPVDQLGGRVLQPQQQEQQDDADLTGELGEALDAVQWHQTAGAEGQTADQVERDGGQTDPAGEAAEEPEPEEDGPELEQLESGAFHQPPRLRILTACSRPSAVPTVTRRSPAVSVKSGVGLGCTWPARITATTETPVRVRRAVSPSVRPSNGAPTGSWRVWMPGRSRCSSLSCATSCGAPSRLASAAASSAVRDSSARHASGSSDLETIRSIVPSRMVTTPILRPLRRAKSLRTPIPGSGVTSTFTPSR